MNTFISKIQKGDSSDFCIIQSTINSDGFQFKFIEFLNDTKTVDAEWTGYLQLEELQNSAIELGMTYENLRSELELIFIKSDNSTIHLFSYTIEDNVFKVQKNEKFKCVYAEIGIQPVQNLRDNILLDCVNLINHKNNKLKEYELKIATLDVEYQTIVQSFRKCVEEKNETEKKLLSKFSLLLNAKKDKIAELQDLLLEKRETLVETDDSEDDTYHSDENIDSVFSQATQKLPKRKQLVEQCPENNLVKLPKRVTLPSNCSTTEESGNITFENDTEEMLDL